MNKKLLAIITLAVGVIAVVVALAAAYLHSHNVAVLNPQGVIATKERNLIFTATALMLIVVVPVYVLTAAIAWKYRAGNTKAKYSPDFDHHKVIEFVWWAIPCAIIGVLAVITWISSHQLDPFRPLDSATRPIRIQVIALQWKWLFIYPEQHIATVNFVEFPQNTPVDFEITSDAPMNSFWIPQLGGQIYAMPGMSTELHLMADHAGTYAGSSANISGRGFAGMKFQAKSTTQGDFDQWVQAVKLGSGNQLTPAEYTRLAQPSENNQPLYYSSADANIYDNAVMKFMVPQNQPAGVTP